MGTMNMVKPGLFDLAPGRWSSDGIILNSQSPRLAFHDKYYIFYTYERNKVNNNKTIVRYEFITKDHTSKLHIGVDFSDAVSFENMLYDLVEIGDTDLEKFLLSKIWLL